MLGEDSEELNTHTQRPWWSNRDGSETNRRKLMPLPLGAFERDCPQSNPRIPLDWTRLSPLVVEVFGSHHELDHEKEIDQPCTIAGARPMRRYTQCFSVIDFSNSQFDQRALTKRHMEACGGPLNRPKRSLYVYIYIYTHTHTHTLTYSLCDLAQSQHHL